MNTLGAALCSLLLASAAAAASLNQPSSQSNLRISGGGDATKKEYRYQVALFEGGNYFCSGAILSESVDAEATSWVITSATCLDGKTGEIEVKAGMVTLDDTTKNVQSVTTTSADRFVHPNFDPQFLDNDIALIKLPKPFDITTYVEPINLPTYADAGKDLAGEEVTITGWGRTGDAATLPASSNVLQKILVTLAANSVCEKQYGVKVIGTKTCLDVDATSKKNACQGDAGAPAMHGDSAGLRYLYGIVSFGFEDGCQNSERPTVLTRVASFLEYIESVTGIPILDNPPA